MYRDELRKSLTEDFNVSVYEGDEPTYTFSAPTEEERDSWIQVLHVASYECLKMQLQSLREQVQAKTGQDPLGQALPSDTGMEYETGSGNIFLFVIFFLSLSRIVIVMYFGNLYLTINP